MSFYDPKNLLYIFIVLALLTGAMFWLSHAKKRMTQWVHSSLWGKIIPEYSKLRSQFKNLTFFLSLLFVVIALGRPQWGETEETIRTEGLDIFFAVDLSNSMLAEDSPPSRLGQAQTFIKKTLQQLKNDRVGLIGFSESPQLSIPLTNDFQYFSDIVDTLDPSSLTRQGTNISAAIGSAIQAFERSAEDNKPGTRALVLISDGEDFGEGASASVKELRSAGIAFFVVGVGKPEGAPIPLRNDSGILQTYKKGKDGKTVLTKPNLNLMKEIAEAGSGTFTQLVSPDDAAYQLGNEINRLSRGARKDQTIVTKIDRFQWFLGLAVFLLFVHLIFSRRVPRQISNGLALLFTLAICSFGTPSLSFAKGDTPSIQSFLSNRNGISQLNQKNPNAAIESFKSAQTTDPTNSVYTYNEAIAHGLGNNLEEARNKFSQSTQSSLKTGDFELATKSLINDGITSGALKDFDGAFSKLGKAIELAKIAGQKDLEKFAREQLLKFSEKQKEEKKQQQQKQDPNQKQNSDEKKDKDEKKSENGEKDEQNKDKPSQTEEGKPKPFQSGTLSKETAESVMNDLSDREKQLYHKRQKEKSKNKGGGEGNDW